jgi:hypothetical protein
MLNNLEKGRSLVAQAIDANGVPRMWVLPLGDFAAAYHAPAIDPVAWEQQKQDMERNPRKPVLDDRLDPRHSPR